MTIPPPPPLAPGIALLGALLAASTSCALGGAGAAGLPAGAPKADEASPAAAPAAPPKAPPLSCAPGAEGRPAHIGLTFIPLPGGAFTQGADDEGSDHAPARRMTVGALCLSKTEVTVSQYAACVQAGACPEPRPQPFAECNWGAPGRGDHPINCIPWAEAQAFAAWVGGRLPTATEWEYAARGAEGRAYPWGDAPEPSCERAVLDPDDRPNEDDGCGAGHTQPVCSRSPLGDTPEGLCDMAGNVEEWTHTWYDAHGYEALAEVGPGGPPDGAARETRGGDWYTGPRGLPAKWRAQHAPVEASPYVGLRIAIEVVGGGR